MAIAYGRSGNVPAYGFPQTVTISTGVATVTGPGKITLQAESGTTDQLDKIVGLSEGDNVDIVADTGDTITIAAGTFLKLPANFTLFGNRICTLLCVGGDVCRGKSTSENL